MHKLAFASCFQERTLSEVISESATVISCHCAIWKQNLPSFFLDMWADCGIESRIQPASSNFCKVWFITKFCCVQKNIVAASFPSTFCMPSFHETCAPSSVFLGVACSPCSISGKDWHKPNIPCMFSQLHVVGDLDGGLWCKSVTLSSHIVLLPGVTHVPSSCCLRQTALWGQIAAW